MPLKSSLQFNSPNLNELDIVTFKFNQSDAISFKETSLSKQEQLYYSTLTHPKRANAFLSSHALLHQVLREHFNLSNPEIVRLPSGQWHLENSKLYFSISHSEQKIFIGLSSFPIGVDVQKKNPHDFLKISEKIFHFKEIQFLEKNNFKEAYPLFSLKESYGKAHGTGLSGAREIDFSKYLRKNFVYLNITKNHISVSLENTDDYVYTTCVLLKK